MTIRKGDRGEKVLLLQAALRGAGIGLPQYGVDGIFGSETEGAVKQAQQMFDLTSTGVADGPLLQALGVEDAPISHSMISGTDSVFSITWILAGLAVGAVVYGMKIMKE